MIESKHFLLVCKLSAMIALQALYRTQTSAHLCLGLPSVSDITPRENSIVVLD
eukprot:m.116321 g.116321  ORF g.116321 m.116321 type:complete len:53 (-) comp17175_c0_seq4:1466-1624(-)